MSECGSEGKARNKDRSAVTMCKKRGEFFQHRLRRGFGTKTNRVHHVCARSAPESQPLRTVRVKILFQFPLTHGLAQSLTHSLALTYCVLNTRPVSCQCREVPDPADRQVSHSRERSVGSDSAE
jgi:hypothetical protein